MTVFTPTFGWPYQALLESPDGASLGEDLALAIEATMVNVNSRLTAAEASITTLNAAAPFRARTIVSVATPSVSFTGVPSALRSLSVYVRGRFQAGGATILAYRINNDAGANYTQHEYGVTDGAASAVVSLNGQTFGQCGLVLGNNAANEFTSTFAVFSGWEQGVKLASTYNAHGRNTGTGNSFSRAGGSDYSGAGPYTRIDFFAGVAANNFDVGTAIYLIGDRT